jgi:hypothetical protein
MATVAAIARALFFLKFMRTPRLCLQVKYILEVPFSGDLGHILGRLKHKRAKKCNKCINPIQLRFSNFTSFPDEAYFSKDEEI